MNHDFIFKRKEVMGRRLKYTEIIVERFGLSRTEIREGGRTWRNMYQNSKFASLRHINELKSCSQDAA
jgi:hypothetical protein